MKNINSSLTDREKWLLSEYPEIYLEGILNSTPVAETLPKMKELKLDIIVILI